MVTFLASILIWLMFFGLVILWIIDGKSKKEIVLHAVFTALVAWILSDIIKLLIPSMRPYELNQSITTTLTVPYGNAFPSTHTAVAVALSLSVYLHHKKTGLLYLIMAFLIGMARIMANVHFPLDIAGGFAVGYISYRLTISKHFARLLN